MATMHGLTTDVFIHGFDPAALAARAVLRALGLTVILAAGRRHPEEEFSLPLLLEDDAPEDRLLSLSWILRNTGLDSPRDFAARLVDAAGDAGTIWLPGAQLLRVRREARRIRSLQLIWDRFAVKVRARIWLECDGRSLLPRLAGEAMQERGRFPADPLFRAGDGRLRERGREFLRQPPQPVPGGVLCRVVEDLCQESGTGAESRHRSPRFWNLLLAGAALPSLSRDPRQAAVAERLLAGGRVGLIAAALFRGRGADPPVEDVRLHALAAELLPSEKGVDP